MKTIKLYFLFISLVLVSGFSFSQERVRPGRVYYAGDTIYGPTYGVLAKIPTGWIGMLPQDSRVFTLMTERGDKDNLFVFGREENIESILDRWRQGVEVTAGVVAKLENDPKIEEGRAYAVLSSEKNPKEKIIGQAVCGEYGFCVTVFAFSTDKDYEEIGAVVREFGESVRFIEPGIEHIYDKFNWEYYLKGKHIFSFQSNQMYKKENNVWLCPDGTFTSKLKRTGIIKEEAKDYKGSKSGTYTISGVGKNGVLTLNFKKQPPVDVEFEIRDDKIYINGIQHFVSQHSTCK